ncbi:uncharacterized protein BXIN_2610 [Babesia sp. Xinjiang]|uniref:uncharacterized protein n=1 Tax=Babesia sp. Xinjiang TaxID=462227 RepID=UPI000A235106|nr:uncharacterized protein BXIN_2711 [Babesia sp. Xinjiang]XP_028872118.1 uncharacterized protein BXIN_2610 [Babesia sp. Xinjiang]ORM41551.1 hypothetical protein BXIN_2711 [Babesia sp. Xinjiang]ORM41662.1 hypothetical protein BXIN_2610 [Babesia sp. Xinjiang]
MVSGGGVIFYRFGSERGIWRELQLDSIGGVLVSDLKILIAQETSLSKDFTRKTNLTVSLYDENSSEAAKPLDDNIVVHAGSRVVLNRVAWVPATPIYHDARTEFEGIVPEEKQNLRPLPISLICKLCCKPMNDPVLVRCSSNCGYSGCCACLISHFKDVLIKNEDGVETVAYNLTDRKACPFCSRGLVSAFIRNRQMAAVLMELDLSNFEIPSFNKTSDYRVPHDGLRMGHSALDLPKYYLLCVDNALIAPMAEQKLLPVYIDSLLCPFSDAFGGHSTTSASNAPTPGDVSAIVVSFVGGGTSISPMGIVQIMEEDRENAEFIKTARAHTAVKFEWLHKNVKPLLIPARRQPMFTYFGAKRHAPVALNSGNDVMWRYTTDLMIEVGLTRKAFDSACEATFGVKPDSLMKRPEKKYKNWLEAAFPGGPPPLYVTRDCRVVSKSDDMDGQQVDLGNPYLGYTAILPFLSESQFLKLRSMQRLVKEEFLQRFTKHVVAQHPEEDGKRVLEKAYNNVWKRHIDYEFPASESLPTEQQP